MSDLTRLLRSLEEVGATAARPAPVDEVTTRRRRRTVVRRAAVGTVAAVAAGAVALSGAALAERGDRDGRALPPASPDPTSVPASPDDWCGARPTDLEPAGGTHPLEVSAGLVAVGLDDGRPVPFEGDPVVAPGEPTALTVDLVHGTTADLPEHRTSLVVVRDGVVVGVLPPPGQDASSTRVRAALPELADLTNGTREVWTAVPRPCDAGDDDVLAEGDYEVRALVDRVAGADGTVRPGAVVSSAVPLRVRARGADADLGALPTCGATPRVLEASQGSVRGTAAAQVESRSDTGESFPDPAGDALDVELGLVNMTASLRHDVTGSTGLVIVDADGTVVRALPGRPADDVGDEPDGPYWAPGSTAFSQTIYLDLVDCAEEPLAPGDYVLWAQTVVSSSGTPGSTERDEWVVVHQPAHVTVTTG